MELSLYGRVVWRFRLLLAMALLVAIALSVLSIYSVHFSSGRPTFETRKHETWQSTAILLLTSKGFPAGIVPGSVPFDVTQQTSPTGTPPVSPNALTDLAPLYARLANSDDVMALIQARGGPIPGTLLASAGSDFSSGRGQPLPTVAISGQAETVKAAISIATRGVAAFKEYVESQQDKARVPQAKRVLINTLNAPQGATLLNKGKNTLAVVVFLAVMFAGIGLAFVLENIRPSIRLVVQDESETVSRAETRRSA